MNREKDFKGIFAPLATPFDGERIFPEKLHENILKYNATGLSGYVILGSSGEAVHLSDGESEVLVKTAKNSASPEKKIIAGTARESTRLTIDFTNYMADLGADAALIRTPGYFKSRMTQEALKKHFLTIADQVRILVIVYNIPRNTGVSIEPPLLLELSRHQNITGFKDSSGNLTLLKEFTPHLDSGFHFLLGAADLLLAGLMLGACGGIITVSTVAPDLCVKLYRLCLEKKWEEASKLQAALVPLNKAVIYTYGIPSAKYALDLLGFYGGPCRLPLLPLEEKARKHIQSILIDSGLLLEAKQR